GIPPSSNAADDTRLHSAILAGCMVSKGLTGEAQTVIPGRCDASNPDSRAVPRRCHAPRRRAIQYAAAHRFNHHGLWNTGSPAFAGDDGRDLRIPAARFARALPIVSPKKGAGKTGCLLHPRSRVQEM